MTGPEGDRHHGWWRITDVDAPRLLAFIDGFADESGTPNPEMPTTIARITLAVREGGGTRLIVASTFSSLEAMEQLVTMGMEEGMKAAMGQIDALLD
jgi:uncharacterized protein YndB with AHSA1/START domain